MLLRLFAAVIALASIALVDTSAIAVPPALSQSPNCSAIAPAFAPMQQSPRPTNPLLSTAGVKCKTKCWSLGQHSFLCCITCTITFPNGTTSTSETCDIIQY